MLGRSMLAHMSMLPQLPYQEHTLQLRMHTAFGNHITTRESYKQSGL